ERAGERKIQGRACEGLFDGPRSNGNARGEVVMRLSSFFGRAMLVGALGLIPVAARAQQGSSTTESPASSTQQNAAKADEAAAQPKQSADEAKQSADEAKRAARQAKAQAGEGTQQATPASTTDITIPFVP